MNRSVMHLGHIRTLDGLELGDYCLQFAINRLGRSMVNYPIMEHS